MAVVRAGETESANRGTRDGHVDNLQQNIGSSSSSANQRLVRSRSVAKHRSFPTRHERSTKRAQAGSDTTASRRRERREPHYKAPLRRNAAP